MFPTIFSPPHPTVLPDTITPTVAPIEIDLIGPHKNKIFEIEVRENILVPQIKNNQAFYLRQKWIFPKIKFTVQSLRKHLEQSLEKILGKTVECWLFGGGANPGDLPYNDIDIGFYIDRAIYSEIDAEILAFVKSLLEDTPEYKSGLFPTHMSWVIYDVYYSARSIFKENAGAIYGLQNVQIKIFEKPHFHCVSPADGSQVSFLRQKLRFATGKSFAMDLASFNRAMACNLHRHYEVWDHEGLTDLIYRLSFKQTTGHTVEYRMFSIAIKQWHEQLQAETLLNQRQLQFITEKNGDVSGQTVQTISGIIAERVFKHQRNHYPTAIGKVIDLLNLLDIIQPHMQKNVAQAWLEKAEGLKLGEEKEFARLITLLPFATPLLLSFLRGVFFCEWAQQKEGQKGKLTAYKFDFMHPQEGPRMQIAFNEGTRSYFLSLGEAGSPNRLSIDLLSSSANLKAILEKHKYPDGLKALSGLFNCLNFSTKYLSDEGSAFIEQILLRAFDSAHVKDVLKVQFGERENPKQVLNLIGQHL
jgi:hypothetical protein